MRKLFLLCFILLPLVGCSQTKYILVQDYPDKVTIYNIINQENLKGSYKALVYQPAVENTNKASSVLLIQNEGKARYWLIKNGVVLGKGRIKGDSIFSYDNILKTGATKREDKLQFVPPLMHGIETENVIYQDNKVRFYYEYGKNVTGYSPNADLNKFRGEWLTIIRKELLGLI
jgi:hypothetical protein